MLLYRKTKSGDSSCPTGPHGPKGDDMKSRMVELAIAATLVLALQVSLAAQSNYRVTELSELGGTAGAANGINNREWVTGADNLSGDLTSMATLWAYGAIIPLGTLGGPNSAVAWPVKNNNGVIVGISETADIDPLGESGSSCHVFFATFPPDGHACQGFRWQNGHMTPLPTLGGTNSYATAANNRGQIVGWAENTVH